MSPTEANLASLFTPKAVILLVSCWEVYRSGPQTVFINYLALT